MTVRSSKWDDVVIRNAGRGLWARLGGSTLIHNSIISENLYGGIYNDEGSSMAIRVQKSRGNRVDGADGYDFGGNVDGGGISNYGYLEISDTVIADNSAVRDGGGILNFGSLVIENSDILRNSAARGGGIWNNGWLRIAATDIASNIAYSSGGGIYTEGSSNSVVLTHSSLTGNSAFLGGGIYATQVRLPGTIRRSLGIRRSSGAENFSCTDKVIYVDISQNVDDCMALMINKRVRHSCI